MDSKNITYIKITLAVTIVIVVSMMIGLQAVLYMDGFVNSETTEDTSIEVIQNTTTNYQGNNVTIDVLDSSQFEKSIPTDIDTFINSTATIYSQDGEELTSQGSAFIYAEKYLMTNEHVISNQNQEQIIKYGDGTWTRGKVIGVDIHTDIAIIKPDEIPSSAINIPIMEENYNSYDNVLAIGSPNDLESTITTGIISGIDRTISTTNSQYSIPGMIQVDAALNPGNSGGPLIHKEEGSIIGVNQATEGENLGFAIPMDIANNVGKTIIEEGEYNAPRIGIQTVELNPVTESEFNNTDSIEFGLVLVDVVENTPASEKFDNANINYENKTVVLKEIDSTPVQTHEELSSYVMRNKNVGDELEMKLIIDGEEKYITIELDERE